MIALQQYVHHPTSNCNICYFEGFLPNSCLIAQTLAGRTFLPKFAEEAAKEAQEADDQEEQVIIA